MILCLSASLFVKKRNNKKLENNQQISQCLQIFTNVY